MDNFMSSLIFFAVLVLGLMISNLRAEIKETRKLLEEVLLQSRKVDNNQSTISKE
jgi:hypothetical protein